MRIIGLGSKYLLIATLVISAGTALGGQTTSQNLSQLVRETVQNEVSENNHGIDYMFLDRKQGPHGSQTKLLVETDEATAGLLVAVNDKPLTPEQRATEEDRLAQLAHNPQELKKKRKSEKEDTDRTCKIIQALPNAFIFEPDGTVAGSRDLGKPGHVLVRLKFRPNPHYSPPSHTEQVLTGMQGIILIDANEHRIAQIDGTLFKDVGFGWGILGHLDRGGHFLVEQADVGQHHWEVTHMILKFNGKALFFKSINIDSIENLSDFQPAPPNLSFAQGVELLKKHEAEVAENHPQGPN